MRRVLSLEFELEADGRWIAEVPELPGALAYGNTKEEARDRVTVLVLRIIAEQIEQGEAHAFGSLQFAAA